MEKWNDCCAVAAGHKTGFCSEWADHNRIINLGVGRVPVPDTYVFIIALITKYWQSFEEKILGVL